MFSGYDDGTSLIFGLVLLFYSALIGGVKYIHISVNCLPISSPLL